MVASSSWMLDRLGDETGAHHRAHDAVLEAVLDDDVGASDYLMYLVRTYGFEAPLECALAMAPNLELVIELRQRARAGFLALDLMLLGLSPAQVAELPQCLAIPYLASPAEALGWMYVAERATLAHAQVLRHLRPRLPHEVAKASTFLQASGGAATRWRAFGATLDRIGRSAAIADRIVEAAGEAFRCHARWVRSEPRGAARKAG